MRLPGCKSERQQTRVRQHVAEPAAHIVKIICAKRQTKRRVFFSLPDISTIPTAPAIANAFAPVLSHAGNTIFICAIDAKISLGKSINIRPIKSINQRTTSQKKSITFPSFRQRYPLIPSPTNRWMTPNNSENTSSFIGSFNGTNQSAGTVIVVRKTSPKQHLRYFRNILRIKFPTQEWIIHNRRIISSIFHS